MNARESNLPHRPGAGGTPSGNRLPTEDGDDPDVRFLAENTAGFPPR